MSCKGCSKQKEGEMICEAGHNQYSYPSSIPKCTLDDFPDKPWPFWLDETGKPRIIKPKAEVMEAESEIKMRLAEIHKEYTEKCAPYIQMLMNIEATKPPRPSILSAAEFDQIDPAIKNKLIKDLP